MSMEFPGFFYPLDLGFGTSDLSEVSSDSFKSVELGSFGSYANGEMLPLGTGCPRAMPGSFTCCYPI